MAILGFLEAITLPQRPHPMATRAHGKCSTPAAKNRELATSLKPKRHLRLLQPHRCLPLLTPRSLRLYQQSSTAAAAETQTLRTPATLLRMRICSLRLRQDRAARSSLLRQQQQQLRLPVWMLVRVLAGAAAEVAPVATATMMIAAVATTTTTTMQHWLRALMWQPRQQRGIGSTL